MKRVIIATAWVMGATVPLMVAAVVLVGCCVLPFHQAAHKLMPLCHVAADLLRADVGNHHSEQQSTPASEKDQPTRRFLTTTVEPFRLIAFPPIERFESATGAMRRNLITLGALRCDEDVGLHLLVVTFLI